MFLHESCGLRPMVQSDLSQVLEWRNSERVRQNMYSDHSITTNEHEKWFASLDPECTEYMVMELEGTPVALSYFTRIDSVNSMCEWGFYLGSSELPRGTGTIMGYLSLERAFGEKEIRKVYAEVLEFNKSSYRFFERLGFHLDGRLRKHINRNDSYVDVMLYSMLSDEWNSTHRERVLDNIEEQPVEIG